MKHYSAALFFATLQRHSTSHKCFPTLVIIHRYHHRKVANYVVKQSVIGMFAGDG